MVFLKMPFLMKTRTKKKRSLQWLGFVFVLLLLLGCERSSSGVSEKFIGTYIELRLASLEFGEANPDARIKRTQILKNNSYTSESFNEYADKIRENPNLWLLFQQRVVEILDSISEPAK